MRGDRYVDDRSAVVGEDDEDEKQPKDDRVSTNSSAAMT